MSEKVFVAKLWDLTFEGYLGHKYSNLRSWFIENTSNARSLRLVESIYGVKFAESNSRNVWFQDLPTYPPEGFDKDLYDDLVSIIRDHCNLRKF